MKTIVLKSISEPVKTAKELFKNKPGFDFHKDLTGNPEGIPMTKYYSLQAVYKIITENPPQRILEFGGGIGTLDYVCLENSKATIDIYEDNEFCQEQLEINLKKFVGRYKIYKDQNNFQCSFDDYDLVIVDGNWFDSIRPLIKKTKNLSKIYFDGCRYKMRKKVIKLLKSKYSCQYTRIHNSSSSPKTGFLLTCKLNNNQLARHLNYLYNYTATIIEETFKRGIKNFILIRLKHLKWQIKKQLDN